MPDGLNLDRDDNLGYEWGQAYERSTTFEDQLDRLIDDGWQVSAVSPRMPGFETVHTHSEKGVRYAFTQAVYEVFLTRR